MKTKLSRYALEGPAPLAGNVSRRAMLSRGLGALALGLSSRGQLTFASTDRVSSEPACALTPEQTIGPYYIDRKAVRYDITEGKPGVPLKHMAWKVLARGGEAAVRSYSSLAAHPEWLDWSSLAELDVEARLSQLSLWVLECDTAQRPYGLRLPGKEIEPSGGAAHRFACLRSLAAFGLAET